MNRQLRKTFSKKKNQRRAIYILSGIVIFVLVLLSVNLRQSNRKASLEYKKNLDIKQKSLVESVKALQTVQKQKAVSDTDLAAQKAQEASLKAKIDDLESQLQSKKEQQESIAARVINTVTLTQHAEAATVSSCGDNEYANFIYMHESGCNLNSVNALGCRGIGQACPGDKLPCGADYACQNAFFTQYAISRYGSWYNAYIAWIAQNWW